MNPTGKNISSEKSWQGLRAPWIGTKQVWKLFYNLNLLGENLYIKIQKSKPNYWDPSFAKEVYENISDYKVYITNLAKCTQLDARPLKNFVFQEYLSLMFKEISIINPLNIITFGNQVSSILLNTPTRVSDFKGDEHKILKINNINYKIYPTHYPVGQGARNMPLAIERIKTIF